MGEEPSESSPPPSPDVPHVRAFVIHGHRSAAVELWGDEGLRAIARALPAETRVRTVDELLLATAWTPVSDVQDWFVAVWDGPAGRSEPRFSKFLERSVDFGFGRVRRGLLKSGSVEQLTARAPAVWRRQHTHGELSSRILTNEQGITTGAITTLRGNPLIETPLARFALAETWRKIITLAGVRGAKQTHGLEDDALVARFTW